VPPKHERDLAAPTRSRPRLEPKENNLVLADILMLVPACIAGIGGGLLGDKLGLWIKGALADRGSR
jgi:hypothetical protein